MTPDEYIDWLLDQISALEAQRDDAQADAAEWRRVLDERYAILLAEAEAAKAENASDLAFFGATKDAEDNIQIDMRKYHAAHSDVFAERDRLAEALRRAERDHGVKKCGTLLTPAPPSSTRNGGLSGE